MEERGNHYYVSPGLGPLTPSLNRNIYIWGSCLYRMGKSVYEKLLPILVALKEKGDRTSYQIFKQEIIKHIGSDTRTIQRVDVVVKELNLLEDEGNGILRIV